MSTSTQRILCFFLSVFMMTSCGKEDVRTNPNPGSYIRLETIGMEVTPKDREVEILFRATDFDHQGVSGITVEDLQIKAACIAMINQKLSNQEIAIYTFDANTILLQDFTANKDALITAINNIPETDLVNSTNLYGAIQQMEDLWDDVYSIQGIEDGSLIVFTDGRHNATPNIDLDDALRAIDGKKRFIAALSSADLDEAALKVLAASNDQYFKAADINGLKNMFLSIQEEIQKSSNSIYYMHYQSPITDPTPFENTLRVEVRNNTNSRSDAFLEETFNSEGFGN